MAPDVPFFAESLLPGVYGQGALTHRWWAVPTVDVLVAGAMAAAWHGPLRGPLTALLPEPGPVPSDAGGGPGMFWAAAALGAATHVAWDSFTHPGRAGVRAVPVLARPVAGVPLCTVLQYGTSVLGLAVLAGRVCRRPLPVRRGRPAAVAAVAAVLAGSAGLGAAHRLARRERGAVDEACFGAGAGLAVGAAGWAAGVRVAAAVRRAAVRRG
jgi:hypothetical protein